MYNFGSTQLIWLLINNSSMLWCWFVVLVWLLWRISLCLCRKACNILLSTLRAWCPLIKKTTGLKLWIWLRYTGVNFSQLIFMLNLCVPSLPRYTGIIHWLPPTIMCLYHYCAYSTAYDGSFYIDAVSALNVSCTKQCSCYIHSDLANE